MINYEYIGTGVSATSTTLESVIGGTPSIVNQYYTTALVKYGTNVSLGNVNFKTTSADLVVKDLYFYLSGLNSTGDMNKISSPTLYEDGVAITTLTKTGNYLYATDINKTIVLGVNKNYEVKATITAVNSASDVLSTFTTQLKTGSFESSFGTEITTVLTGDISNTIKVVNEVPTITILPEGKVKGNDVVYKLTLTSDKQVDLSGLTLSVNGTNLTGGLSGTTAYLAPTDVNYSTNEYTTGTIANTTLTFAGLAKGLVVINGTKVIYVIIPGAALLGNTNGNTATVRIAATNMDYMDIFTDDNSAKLNQNMLYNYASEIAGDLDLLTIVNIQ
jgi:hypothetical protein